MKGCRVAKRKPRKRCFLCDGTGQICDICGESATACECLNDGLEPTFSECEACLGTGGHEVEVNSDKF